MVWYEELGFDENPFDLNPLNRDDELVGREEIAEELIYRINSGSMILVVGKEGVGKTMLLKYAIDKNKGKVIYIDGSKVNKRLNIEELLKKGAGFISRNVFGNKPKGMILLLDNVQNLTTRNNKKIKFYFDQGYIHSAVFTTSDFGSISFTDSIKDRIGKRVIKLRDLPLDDVIQISKDRLEGNQFLPEEIISELFAVSNKNLKTLLLNCGKVCEQAIEDGDEIVKRDHIKEALGKDEIEEEENPETCFECGDTLERYGENWVCPTCDTYCTNCGSFVHEEDSQCPKCEVMFDEDDKDD